MPMAGYGAATTATAATTFVAGTKEHVRHSVGPGMNSKCLSISVAYVLLE